MLRLRVSGFTVFSTAARRVIWDTRLGTFLANARSRHRTTGIASICAATAPVRRYDKCGDGAILT